MSADSYHHAVERQMTRQPGGNGYDFSEFVGVLIFLIDFEWTKFK